MGKQARLTATRFHVESGSLVGRVERYPGVLKRFDYSWGSHEAYWGDQVMPGSYDGWITDLVESIFTLINAELVRQGYTDETPVRAILTRRDEAWTIDQLELVQEFESLTGLTGEAIQDEFGLPAGTLDPTLILPAGVREIVLDAGPLPVRLIGT